MIRGKNEKIRFSKNHDSYRNLLNELKSILNKGQARAYKAFDNIKVQTYWQVGGRIAGNARKELEKKTKTKVSTKDNFKRISEFKKNELKNKQEE